MTLKIKLFIVLICCFLSFSFAQNSDQPNPNVQNQNLEFPKVQLSLYGGLTFRPLNIKNSYDAKLKDYLRRNLFGVNYGLDVTMFLNPKFGLGVKINENREGRFMSAVVRILDPYFHPKYSVFEAFSTITAGPYVSFLFDQKENGKRKFLNLGLGYMHYQYQSIFNNFVKVKTWTIGTFIDYGYHFRINQNNFFLLKFSVYNGVYVFSKVNNTTTFLPNNSFIWAPQLNISIGYVTQN